MLSEAHRDMEKTFSLLDRRRHGTSSCFAGGAVDEFQLRACLRREGVVSNVLKGVLRGAANAQNASSERIASRGRSCHWA